jgi:hypothetical protein
MRNALLSVTLVFTSAIALLMVYDIARHGLRLLVIPTLIVLALFTVGIVGALRHPPEE